MNQLMTPSQEELMGSVLATMILVFGSLGIGLFLWGAGRYLIQQYF